MAHWIKCTLRPDGGLISINLEAASSLHWNDDGKFTSISWINTKESIVRVAERPEELLESVGEIPEAKNEPLLTVVTRPVLRMSDFQE